MKYLKFTNGDKMPMLGLGTAFMAKANVYETVRAAIKIGYRHFDCAPIHKNQSEIGEALNDAIDDGEVEREDLWITSKLWNDSHKYDDVESALEETLEELQLDYLDLYMVHWPVAQVKGTEIPKGKQDYIGENEAALIDTWTAMEDCLDSELTKHIGMCNSNIKTLNMLRYESTLEPEVLQVEMHPYLPQQPLYDFCRQAGIHVVGYAPLGSPGRPSKMKHHNEPDFFSEPALLEMSEKHGISTAQALVAYGMSRKIALIPSSTKKTHLIQNFEAVDMKLDREDLRKLIILPKYRFFKGEEFTSNGSPYRLTDLWEY
ncbi:MAG: aldo/keto reductase [Cyclobacteriaceae bacterium]